MPSQSGHSVFTGFRYTCTVVLLIASLAGVCLLCSAAPAADPGVPPEFLGKPVRLCDVRWTGGFWKARQDMCFSRSLPAMTHIMTGTQRSQFLENFRIAAGVVPGRHRGPDWNDGDAFKWLEACSAAAAVTESVDLRTQLQSAVDLIRQTQRDDGYLHTPVLIAARNGDQSARPFGDPANFEMYNFGHLMSAAVVHFECTGRRDLLDVAIRAADFLDREFSDPDRDLARHAVCPSHYMGILDLYRVTQEPRYPALAKRWMQMRDLVQGGGDDNQDRVPFREQRDLVGHAVRANYLMAGAADLFLETRDSSLLPALHACWNDLVSAKCYVTGGCGALFDGASPDGSELQKSITRVHQAYGRRFQLPNSTAHNETCAAVGSVYWNFRMLQITGDAKFADHLETTFLNAVLAGISLDGTRYFYTNTLRQLNDMPTALRWSRQREEWISCYCCPPNVLRLLAQAGRYAYLLDAEALTTVLYGANSLETQLSTGEVLKLSQHSHYPADGRIQLTIHDAPSRDFTIRLRIPGWCEAWTATVNDQPIPRAAVSNGYAEVRRTWKPGDTVLLNLDMPVQLLQAHPLVEECRGQAAVQRGPVVYCLESCDLPAGTSVLDVRISPDTEWRVAPENWATGSQTVLRGQLSVSARQAHSAEPGSGSLYHPFRKSQSRQVDVMLVPYFAWGNRGQGEMTVWIRLND